MCRRQCTRKKKEHDGHRKDMCQTIGCHLSIRFCVILCRRLGSRNDLSSVNMGDFNHYHKNNANKIPVAVCSWMTMENRNGIFENWRVQQRSSMRRQENSSSKEGRIRLTHSNKTRRKEQVGQASRQTRSCGDEVSVEQHTHSMSSTPFVFSSTTHQSCFQKLLFRCFFLNMLVMRWLGIWTLVWHGYTRNSSLSLHLHCYHVLD